MDIKFLGEDPKIKKIKIKIRRQMAIERIPTAAGRTLQKRTPEEVLRDEIIIANMFFQAVPMTKMSKELKLRSGSSYALSNPTITETIRDMTALWKEKNLIKVDEVKNRELKKLDALEDEYWRAWHRSCLPRREKERKQQRGFIPALNLSDDDGHVLPAFTETMVETEKRVREYDREGSSRFLEGIERCIEKRCRLLGLYSPIKITPQGLGIDPTEEYDLPLDEIGRRMIAVIKNTNIQINVDNRRTE